MPSNLHVRSGVSRARDEREAFYPFTPDGRTDLGGIPVVSSRFVPEGKWLLGTDPARGGAAVVLVGEHHGEAAACIAAELVACTLGQRRRPELRMSLGGLVTTKRLLAR
jgi:hypothetical protein